MREMALFTPRLVANVKLWGVIDDEERDALISWITFKFKNSKLDARIYLVGDDEGAPIVGIRFNGCDIDRVAKTLDITAGDLLSREVGLGNPYEVRGQ